MLAEFCFNSLNKIIYTKYYHTHYLSFANKTPKTEAILKKYDFSLNDLLLLLGTYNFKLAIGYNFLLGLRLKFVLVQSINIGFLGRPFKLL